MGFGFENFEQEEATKAIIIIHKPVRCKATYFMVSELMQINFCVSNTFYVMSQPPQVNLLFDNR